MNYIVGEKKNYEGAFRESSTQTSLLSRAVHSFHHVILSVNTHGPTTLLYPKRVANKQDSLNKCRVVFFYLVRQIYMRKLNDGLRKRVTMNDQEINFPAAQITMKKGFGRPGSEHGCKGDKCWGRSRHRNYSMWPSMVIHDLSD